MTIPAVRRRFPSENLDSEGLLAFLGARAVAGIEERDGNRWSRALSHDGRPAVLSLVIAGGPRRVEVRATASVAIGRDPTAAYAARLLGLDADLAAFRRMARGDPILGPLVRRRPGLRIPLLPGPFEAAVRAVVGQLISVAAARTVLARMIERFGEPATDGWRLFPEPDAFRPAVESRLAAAGLPRVKVRALVALGGAGPLSVATDLERLPGIGPWTAGYVRFRGLGDPDVFLAGDLGIRQALEALGVPPHRQVAVAERWRPWRSLAMRHLWASLADR